jgi:hypothetical protein
MYKCAYHIYLNVRQEFLTTFLEVHKLLHYNLGHQNCQHCRARLRTTDICAIDYRVAAMTWP